MAIYKVTDPSTGKTISLEGNSPPTETELEDIFSNLNSGSSSQKQTEGSYFGDAGRSAVKELKMMATGLPKFANEMLNAVNTPTNAVSYPFDRMAGVQHNDTRLMRGIDTGMGIPKMIGEGIVDTGKTIAHPIDSFRNKPINTVLTAASIVAPFLKGPSTAANVASKAATASEAGLMQKAFAKSSQVAFGTPEEAVLARLKNPNAVKTAFSHPELADQMVNSVKNFKETLSGLAEDAHKTLRSSPYLEDGAIPKDQVLKAVKSAKNDIGGAWTADSKAAVGAIRSTLDTFKQKLKSTVSESQVKDLIKDLDNNINWGNPAATKSNEALIGIRTRLDKILKNQNSDYESAMVPVDEATRVFNKVQDTFGVKYETARGFYATDSTVNKIKRALKEDKLGTQGVLSRFEKITGEDWQTKIKNANALEAFNTPGKSFGSTRSNTMGVIGEAAGNAVGLPPFIGAGMGAVTGAFQNFYGPQISARIIDVLADPKMARYATTIQNASTKGAQNAVATHALLMETDPTYAKAMRGKSVPVK